MKITIAIPAYNEEKIIGQKIDQLFKFCQEQLSRPSFSSKNLGGYQWLIVVAINGSKDKTLEIVQEKSKIYSNLEYVNLDTPGKGGAIRKAWQTYTGDINIFMDADLSTELKSIHKLIKAIEQENYQIVIGSRYQKQSHLERSVIRSLFSHTYNLILKIFFNLKITDASCGFKAVSKKVIEKIVPKIKNNDLFFDTELLILARQSNLSIKEIPVTWRDEKQRKTKIKIFKTSFAYFKEIIKLKARLLKRRAKISI
ncbi:glycosyltransferase [Patescibacteria group bacterium]|nr:glycosyltransferase [Patescibacteria group bacterium]